MSFRLLLFSPEASTRIIRIRAIPQQWCTPSVPQDVGFLRLWLVGDTPVKKCINWGAISGLAISVVVSAACWTGLALMVQWVWK